MVRWLCLLTHDLHYCLEVFFRATNLLDTFLSLVKVSVIEFFDKQVGLVFIVAAMCVDNISIGGFHVNTTCIFVRFYSLSDFVCVMDVHGYIVWPAAALFATGG